MWKQKHLVNSIIEIAMKLYIAEYVFRTKDKDDSK